MDYIPYSVRVKRFETEHVKEKRCYLMSSRFTEETRMENRKFCQEHNVKAAYCCPIPISVQIPPEVFIFVLEMNNDTNRIIGIGFITNKTTHKMWIYEDGNYNRNTYLGKRRIDRTEMNAEEEQIMELLDNYCFKGYGHLKRGQGITLFPTKYLFESFEKNVDIMQALKNMFNSRNKKIQKKVEEGSKVEEGLKVEEG